MKKAAAELFNLQAGARPEATKFLIVFSDGDFIPFSLVSIRKFFGSAQFKSEVG